MKAKVLQRSRILRYEGSFPTLSAFFLSPSPVVADSETVEMHGDGSCTESGEAVSLSYREEESGVSVAVEKNGNELTIVRDGSPLVFRVGETTSFHYSPTCGTFLIEAYTDALTVQRKGDALLLTLSYTAAMGGMAQRTEMRFKIIKK